MTFNCIEFGDCRATMRRWLSEGVKAQMCVTSPPYFGLRDYGHEGQIGLEKTPEEYTSTMVEVFRCVRDMLADGALPEGLVIYSCGRYYDVVNLGMMLQGRWYEQSLAHNVMGVRARA